MYRQPPSKKKRRKWIKVISVKPAIGFLLRVENTFERLLILDNVGMTHVGKNSNFSPRFLPLFTWHLSNLKNWLGGKISSHWYLLNVNNYVQKLTPDMPISLMTYWRPSCLDLTRMAFPNEPSPIFFTFSYLSMLLEWLAPHTGSAKTSRTCQL